MSNSGPVSPSDYTAYAAPAPSSAPAPVLDAKRSGGPLPFGGRNHDVFIGCLDCSKYDSGSVWNKYGDYGSKYSDKSFWNRYGIYGSKYSDESPWNPYAQTPPVIVDGDGKFYGYFTANRYFAKRTRVESLLQILDNYETIIENFDDIVSSLH